MVASNLSQITHWCKFLSPKKATGVNGLPYSNSDKDTVNGNLLLCPANAGLAVDVVGSGWIKGWTRSS